MRCFIVDSNTTLTAQMRLPVHRWAPDDLTAYGWRYRGLIDVGVACLMLYWVWDAYTNSQLTHCAITYTAHSLSRLEFRQFYFYAWRLYRVHEGQTYIKYDNISLLGKRNRWFTDVIYNCSKCRGLPQLREIHCRNTRLFISEANTVVMYLFKRCSATKDKEINRTFPKN